MYVRGYLQGSENGRVVTIVQALMQRLRESNITTGLFGLPCCRNCKQNSKRIRCRERYKSETSFFFILLIFWGLFTRKDHLTHHNIFKYVYFHDRYQKQIKYHVLVVYGDSSVSICGGSRRSDHCACLTGSDVTGSHVTFSLTFPVLFSRSFSNVAMFEIQRFKISVSCFSSTCRYNTVHVPCGISIQTSPIGLPLDGLGARMRDLKGSKMNLFNLKED